jgi:uncharacterized membrane protein YidH (DUF202 family)
LTAGQDGDEPRTTDPGLARERTELAWTRSTISFAALGVLILRFRPAIGVPILAFSAIVWWAGRLPRRPGGSAPRRLLLVTLAVTALALAALVFTLIGQDSKGLQL